jgi:hypothetical protein
MLLGDKSLAQLTCAVEAQIQEMNQLQQSLYDLERTHTKMKKQ